MAQPPDDDPRPPEGPPPWAAPDTPPPQPPAGYPPPPPGAYPPPGVFPPGVRPSLPKGGSARTGPLPLHPMSLGDVLDGAFKLFKANARTIIIVVAVIVLPLQFGTAFVLRDSYEVGFVDIFTDPSVIEASTETQGDAGQLVTILVSALLGILVTPFIAGAICRVVAASYLGNQIGPGDALSAAGRRFWPLLGSFILVHLIEGVALLLCIIPVLFVMPLYTLVAPAIVEENLGPIQGMSRSWGLVRRRYWPILGISLLAGLIANLLGSALGFVPSVLAAFFGGTFAWLLVAIGSLLSTIVSTPLVAIVATLLYFDARIRHEGFDLQVISRDLQARAY